MNVPFARLFALWLGLVALTAVLFAKTHTNDVASYKPLIDTLSELRAVDATLNQDVTRARYRLLANDDPLVEDVGKLNQLLQQFQQEQRYDHRYTEIETKLQRLAEILAQKTALVDYFKSDNAVLKNSLSHYHFAPRHIPTTETAVGADKIRLPADLRQLWSESLNSVLEYSQSGEPERRKAAETYLNTIRQYAAVPTLHPTLEHLARYTKVILEYTDRVDTLLAQILALPSTQQAEELYRIYATEYEKSVREINRYRTLLYLFCAFLLGYTVYIFYRLRDNIRALFQEKERAQVTLHSIGDGVITTDAGGHIEYMNPAAEYLSGYRTEEVFGRSLEIALGLTRLKSASEDATRTDATPVGDIPTRKKQQALLMRRDGIQITIDESVSSIHGQGGVVMGEIRVFHDVTEARQLASKLEWQATHDLLTGLANRPKFERHLERAREGAREYGHVHAILFLDLDQFKIVNDSCGHHAGDELLRQLGRLMASNVHGRDTVARLGGDEFGILLENCPIDQARCIADNLLDAVKHFRFMWHGQLFDVSMSIGLVAVNQINAVTDVLITADMACYAAKKLGRNRVHVHQDIDVSPARNNEP